MSQQELLDRLLEAWKGCRALGETPMALDICQGHEDLLPELSQVIDRRLRLDDLVEQWEEQMEAGDDPRPEDVCRNDPDLLEEFLYHVADLETFDRLFGDKALRDLR